jgi:competence protein ComEA
MKQTLWKEYFTFSRQERIGISVLLVLISICISAPAAWEHYHPEEIQIELTPVVKAAPQPKKGWIKLKAPVHKELKKTQTTFVFKKKEAPAPAIIDINEADTTAWMSLPGIGPVLANRIIRYRNRLGGFYAISQVAETFGLPDSTFVKIQASLQLNKVSLKNLDINQMDEKSLAQHPYIHYKLARLIVLYRSNNGPFREAEELLGIPLVDDSIYRKLEPYIKTIK